MIRDGSDQVCGTLQT